MGVCRNVCYVVAVVKDNSVFGLGVLKMLYVCVRGVMDVMFSVCILMHGAVGACVWEVCVSCRCCMFVSCVHPVAVLNTAFCMNCSLLMLVEDATGIPQSQSHECLIGIHECLLLFTTSC